MRHRPLTSVPALLALALAAALPASFGGTRASDPAAAAAAHRYTIRGQVVRLPDAPGGQISLRHEAIDDFVNASGAVVGMDAMVMPFDVAPDVSLQGLRAGDAVEAQLSVDWSRPSMRLERLRKLPDGTELRFTKARPPQAR